MPPAKKQKTAEGKSKPEYMLVTEAASYRKVESSDYCQSRFSRNLEELAKRFSAKVSAHLQEGWQLHGPPTIILPEGGPCSAVTVVIHSQAMVKL